MDSHARQRRAEWDRRAEQQRRHENIDRAAELAAEQPPAPASDAPAWKHEEAAQAAIDDRIRHARRMRQQANGMSLAEIAQTESPLGALFWSLPDLPADTRARIRAAALLEADNARWDAATQAEFRRIAATI